MWLSPQARIVGPSLSRKKRLRIVIARKKASEESLPMPSSRPPIRAEALSLGAPAELILGAVGLAAVEAEVLEPAADRVLGRGEVAGDAARLPVDADDDGIRHERAGRDDPEHQQYGSRGARDPMGVEPGDDRRADRRHDGGDDHRDRDHLGHRQQPDQGGEQQHRADEQPGHQPDVPQPVGDVEDAAQLARLELEVLRLGLRRTRPILASVRWRRSLPRIIGREPIPPPRHQNRFRRGSAGPTS